MAGKLTANTLSLHYHPKFSYFCLKNNNNNNKNTLLQQFWASTTDMKREQE